MVTGASRGVGRGVALGLCASWRHRAYYGTNGSAGPIEGSALGRFATSTAEECNRSGGRCFPHVCDHQDDALTKQVFQEILDSEQRIDVLVNSAWGGYEAMVDEHGKFTWMLPWQQPISRWDGMLGAGLRARYVAAQEAARHMVSRRQGLIVNISSWAAQKYAANVA